MGREVEQRLLAEGSAARCSDALQTSFHRQAFLKGIRGSLHGLILGANARAALALPHELNLEGLLLYETSVAFMRHLLYLLGTQPPGSVATLTGHFRRRRRVVVVPSDCM